MNHHHIHVQSGSSITEGGLIHLIPSAIALTPSLHLVRSAASWIFNSSYSTVSSTCLLLVVFGRPRFRIPFTSSIIAFSILSSFLQITCPYYLTPFAFAILSNVSFKPSISISSSLFFLSTNFTSHIDLTMALSVLLRILISLSLKTKRLGLDC